MFVGLVGMPPLGNFPALSWPLSMIAGRLALLMMFARRLCASSLQLKADTTRGKSATVVHFEVPTATLRT